MAAERDSRPYRLLQVHRPQASQIVSALEVAWSTIASRHPELPAAMVFIGAGSDRRQGLVKWGHFAALRWRHEDAALPEVLVAGEGLSRGPEDVLGTLLHEAAHALADVRQIQDTSRGGRYHNRRYLTLAEEVGLVVSQMTPFGWARTDLRPETAGAYAPELNRLRAALVVHRVSERQPEGGASGGEGGGSSRNLLPASCGCGRRIRIAPSTLAAGPIVCGVCGGEFEAAAPALGDVTRVQVVDFVDRA
jgi:hypothetical protein